MKRFQLGFLMIAALAFVFSGCPAAKKMLKDTANSTSKQAKQQATSMAAKTQKDTKTSLLQTAANFIKGLSGDKDKKKSSVNSLVAMGAKVVPALVNALKSDKNDKKTKLGVLEVLGKLGSKATGAKDAVNQTAKSDDKDLQVAAKQTLTQIDGK
jgi:hypothetical protein